MDLQELLKDSVGNAEAIIGVLTENPELCASLPHRELNLGYSALTVVPEAIGLLVLLRRLCLGHSRLTQLPDSLGCMSSLTTLDLSWCHSLKRLPDSLGQLAALMRLELGWCTGLSVLPDSLGCLTNLTLLGLRACVNLTQVPESLGCLTNLTVLVLHACTHLTQLPESLGRLQALKELQINCCLRLARLPVSFAFLPPGLSVHWADADSLVFPPMYVKRFSLTAVREFLLEHNEPLKMLLLILSARRRRVCHLPAELWVLMLDKFFIYY